MFFFSIFHSYNNFSFPLVTFRKFIFDYSVVHTLDLTKLMKEHHINNMPKPTLLPFFQSISRKQYGKCIVINFVLTSNCIPRRSLFDCIYITLNVIYDFSKAHLCSTKIKENRFLLSNQCNQ